MASVISFIKRVFNPRNFMDTTIIPGASDQIIPASTDTSTAPVEEVATPGEQGVVADVQAPITSRKPSLRRIIGE